jgi:hypothetical protein
MFGEVLPAAAVAVLGVVVILATLCDDPPTAAT